MRKFYILYFLVFFICLLQNKSFCDDLKIKFNINPICQLKIIKSSNLNGLIGIEDYKRGYCEYSDAVELMVNSNAKWAVFTNICGEGVISDKGFLKNYSKYLIKIDNSDYTPLSSGKIIIASGGPVCEKIIKISFKSLWSWMDKPGEYALVLFYEIRNEVD